MGTGFFTDTTLCIGCKACEVACKQWNPSFKQPSKLELAHDFLWRIHAAAPPNWTIGIFNRSEFEDVLIARVHNLVPKKTCQSRYEQINHFEELLVSSGV
jgi:polyphosphate kinase 2 (PPK2 family)